MYAARDPARKRRPFIPLAERMPKRAPKMNWVQLLSIPALIVATASFASAQFQSRATERQQLAAEITNVIVAQEELKGELLQEVELFRQLNEKAPLSDGMLQSAKQIQALADRTDKEIQDLVSEDGMLFAPSAWMYTTSSLSRERFVYMNLQKVYEGLAKATKVLNGGLKQSLARKKRASSKVS
jgi:hypothetical protein